MVLPSNDLSGRVVQIILIGPLPPLSLSRALAQVCGLIQYLSTEYKGLDENQEQFHPVVEGYALVKSDGDITAPMTDS